MAKTIRSLTFLILSLWTSIGFADGVALVIVDMQPKFAEKNKHHNSKENRERFHQVLARQKKLIRAAKKKRVPILIIEFDKFGRTDSALVKEIGKYGLTKTFVKKKDGMFEAESGVSEDIEKFLNLFKVTNLIFAGANGRACVRCSIEGALNRGFKVWTDAQSIIDFNLALFIFPYKYKLRELSLDSIWLRRNFNQLLKSDSFEKLFDDSEPPIPLSKIKDFARCGELLKAKVVKE